PPPVRRPSAHGPTRRFAPAKPLRTAPARRKIILNAQNWPSHFAHPRSAFGPFAQNPAVFLLGFAVAPLAGSVDRNGRCGRLRVAALWSLPSRGAWIEIWSGSTR